MDAAEFAEQLRAALSAEKTKGNEFVATDALLRYLDSLPLDGPPSEAELERYKADLARWIDGAKHQHESYLELFRSVITAGQAAIKILFTVNGGAAVAMLAFIGHLATNDPKSVSIFAGALLPFAGGVLAAALTSAGTYLTQWLYAGDERKKWGASLHLLSIVCGLGSLGLFAYGIWFTYRGFGEFSQSVSP